MALVFAWSWFRLSSLVLSLSSLVLVLVMIVVPVLSLFGLRLVSVFSGLVVVSLSSLVWSWSGLGSGIGLLFRLGLVFVWSSSRLCLL